MTMHEAIIWLLKLILAHLLTDFVLQPAAWVTAKREKHLAAPAFWWHLGLTTLMAALFTNLDSWWVPLVIFVTHGLIDWWKSYRPENAKYYLIDQLLHLLVIGIVWALKFPAAISPVKSLYHSGIRQINTWLVFMAMIFLTSPVGTIVGLLTKPFREKLTNHEVTSLANAGTWIGVLERLIIFFLVLINQFEAIGLLIAAKSIIRLKEGDQKMSEYVLVGTLISVFVAMVTGYLVSKII